MAQVFIRNLVNEVIAKTPLFAIKYLTDSGIYKAPAVYIYEKQQLMWTIKKKILCVRN